MEISRQILFFLSGLGAFNGLLLSIYFLFFAKPKHISNLFLGGLLLMLSIRIGKSVFFFFNPDLAKIYLQIGLSACFFIGPFLFLYVQAKTSLERSQNTWKYLLALLLTIAVVVGYLYPYETNVELWSTFYKVINYQWLLFILGTAYLLRHLFDKAFIKRLRLDYQEVWLLNVFFSVFLIWMAYFMAFYTSYIVGALSFSVVLYLSIYVLFFYKDKKKEEPKERYANKKIEAVEAQQLLAQIEDLMQKQELYKDPNLNLSKLAKALHISPHLLSQLVNDNLNKRFSHFINEYRIKEAQKMLKSNSHLKMEVIAEQCGFNSNSTFYTAFKKVTSTTPAKFMNEQK